MKQNYKEKLQTIKALVFDCDGVFTDGSMVLTETGYLARVFNAKDGFALQLLLKKGIKVGIITGAADQAVRQRFENLGVLPHDIYLKANDKTDAFETFLLTYDLTPDEVLYMGDDLPDIPLLQQVGIAACPQDAAIEVKELCDYVSNKDGGKGCVRDIIEQTLRVKQLWMQKDDVIIPKRAYH